MQAIIYEMRDRETGNIQPNKNSDWLKLTRRYKSNFKPITKKHRRDVMSSQRDPKNKCLQPATAGRKRRKTHKVSRVVIKNHHRKQKKRFITIVK